MQLKRNKEMEFETLKKSHKKQLIIGVLAICIAGSALTFATTRAKYKLTQDLELARGIVNYKPYDFKMMAMYKSEDGSNYTEINTMPESGYVINEEKTYCTTDNKTQVKGKIKTENGKHYITGLSKSDKCYLYFDKKNIITIGNNEIEYKTETPDFSQIADTDEGIYAVEDGMYGGTSYYWRGAVSNNYVKFADKCWRIVRINGDKSIRLIYDGATCHANGTSTTESIAVVNTAYNKSYNQSNYVGWTYSGTSQRTTGGTTSNAKTQLETWYNANITGTNATKVASGKYCNDRDAQSGSTWAINPSSTFYYAAYKRMHTDYTPTLSCSSGDVYILSVGLITADEVAYAGGMNANNKQYYLYNGRDYWTLSPYSWGSDGYAHVFIVGSSGDIYHWGVNNAYGLRPVINLKADITFFSGGDGTLNNPYVVQ